MADATKIETSELGTSSADAEQGRVASLWEQLRRSRDADEKSEESEESSWTMDRIFATLAAVLLPLGIVAIGLAWYGASHTPFLFEQIPYLISGGLLGLGLLTAGGLLYIGTWIARLAEQQRDQADRLQEVMEGLREDLRDGISLPSGDATRRVSTGTAAFVATPTGSMFHRRDCAIVVDRNDLHEVNGHAPDLQPCKMCDPLADEAATD